MGYCASSYYKHSMMQLARHVPWCAARRWLAYLPLYLSLCFALYFTLSSWALAQSAASPPSQTSSLTSPSPASSPASTAYVPPSPIVIDQAQALVTVQGASELSLVALPYHWDRLHKGQPGEASFEVAFELPGEPAEPYAALLPRVGNRFEIWLNGTLLSRNGDLNAPDTANYAKAPRYVPIPPQLLQKTNLLRIQIQADGGRRGGLSTITVGTEPVVRAAYDASYRWRIAGALAVLIVMLLTGLVAAALWFTQLTVREVPDRAARPAQAPQRDRMYGYAALAALCWSLRLSDTMIENPPLPWPYWSVLMALALSGAVFFIVLFSIHVAQWQHQRWARLLERAVPALLLVCAGMAALAMWGHQPLALTVWYACTTVAGTLFTAVYVAAALRSQRRAHWLMAASLLANLLLNIYDVWSYRIAQQLSDSPISSYASVLYGLTMFYIVVSRFRSASHQARDLLHTLEQRVADKESELASSYQKLEVLAREQERGAERTRILRDMHDGVGSHISAAIRQLQSGKATHGEVLLTLRDSLDQLKLSIDSMHLVPGDVTALLANMRYRLEPRFVSSGMAFEWDVDLLAQIDRLDHSAMRQLQYMVFEALSNVLQHSHAHTLRIQARSEGAQAVVRVMDDGCGFDTGTVTTRGLASMRERAAAIRAQLAIHSSAQGTTVEIRL
jgi:signal transduction histidine kinase